MAADFPGPDDRQRPAFQFFSAEAFPQMSPLQVGEMRELAHMCKQDQEDELGQGTAVHAARGRDEQIRVEKAQGFDRSAHPGARRLNPAHVGRVFEPPAAVRVARREVPQDVRAAEVGPPAFLLLR